MINTSSKNEIEEYFKKSIRVREYLLRVFQTDKKLYEGLNESHIVSLFHIHTNKFCPDGRSCVNNSCNYAMHFKDTVCKHGNTCSYWQHGKCAFKHDTVYDKSHSRKANLW